MTPFLIATANGIHALAIIVFVGYYLLLSGLFLPALAGTEMRGGTALGEISKRSRPWLYGSLLVFIITGIYLMFADPNYQGIGSFGNSWAILMLVKHVFILAMIVVGLWYNALQRIGPALRYSPGDAQAIGRFRRYSNVMALCGILAVLLTAFAQVE
jgi:uncharacterized membrane protein